MLFIHLFCRRKKLAGVLLLGTGGIIPPMSVTHMETNCQIKENKVIHPYAYRTHTHSLGKVVSGYRVREDKFGKDSWTLLGKRDPLTAQMFYPVFNSDPIRYGDKLVRKIIAVMLFLELFHSSFRCRPPDVRWKVIEAQRRKSGECFLFNQYGINMLFFFFERIFM